MAEPPEFWAFIASNLLVLAAGTVLTVLSYRAYRRSRTLAFRTAAAGFGFITAGALAEAVYELGVRRSYHLGGRELLLLHTVEGILIGAGLMSLFYSLHRY
ncbi:DUF7521 family protein [Salinirarus marinus]|uniref:DUF7521 family protein n=1 Tax=Salinirarus marinus TaxID=3068310 RepID=UPI003C6CA71F